MRLSLAVERSKRIDAELKLMERQLADKRAELEHHHTNANALQAEIVSVYEVGDGDEFNLETRKIVRTPAPPDGGHSSKEKQPPPPPPPPKSPDKIPSPADIVVAASKDVPK